MELFCKLFGNLLVFVGSEEAHSVALALASVRRPVGSRTDANRPEGPAYPLLPVSSGSASLAEP